MPTNHNILQFSGVTVRYGDLTALRDVTLAVPCGSSTAVLGANGAGKSTLLRAVVGLRRLSSGEILIGDAHPHHARPRLAYVPQRHSVDWDFPITVRGVVEQGRYPSLGLLRRLGRADVELVDGAMAELGILDLSERQIRRLSGGQQQRVFLARAVAQGGDIFLLDEPFAGLDLFAVEELARDLRDWEAQGRTVLAAMHDLEIARTSFKRGILLATELVAEGPIGDVLEEHNIRRAYQGRGDLHGRPVSGAAPGGRVDMSLHEFLVEPFYYEFMRRGLCSAVLLGMSGGLLGCVLVLRRLALMGDALSHSLLPGVAAAWLLFGMSTASLFVGGLIAGLLTALGSALLSRMTRIKEDAAFGSLFILFFAAGVALINKLPTQLNLSDFLFGNVLGVSAADVRLSMAVSGLTVAAFVAFHRSVLLETFDPIFHRATGGRGGWVHMGFLALTVLNLVAAMQTMGIVLALGLFLLPAVSAYLWCDRFISMLLLSVAIAVLGSFAGILLSFHAGLTSGPAIVLSLGVLFIASALFSPRHGVIRVLRENRGPAAAE